MFDASPENLMIEEVIRKNWPTHGSDASVNDECDWEILNDNNANDATSRHWFKQNYINQMPQHTSSVMYH